MRPKMAYLLLFILVASLSGPRQAQAVTVEFQSASDSFNESKIRWATMASASLGQMPSTKEYGIFVNVRERQDPDDRNSRAQKKLFFTPVDGKLEAQDGKLYYVSPSGQKSLLAEKGFWGWKQQDNVSIYTRTIREPGRLRMVVELDIY